MARFADDASLSLRVVDTATTFDIVKSYRYTENYLATHDTWTVTLGDEQTRDDLVKLCPPGAIAQISIGSQLQSTGIIDRVESKTGRDGAEVQIDGSSRIAPAVRGCVDPTTKFKASQTLADLLKGVFAPFGFSDDSNFVVQNDDNRGVLTGQKRGTPTTKRGKPLKSFKLHQLKPYPNEGAFAFASRICQRRGMWLRLSADGQTIVCATPDFSQTSISQLIRRRGTHKENNVQNSSCVRDGTEQPAVLITTGFGTGGEHDHGTLKVAAVNELVAYDKFGIQRSQVTQALQNHKDAILLPPRTQAFPPAYQYGLPWPQPKFVHDDESKTLEQLQHFTARELSLYQHKAFVYHATIEGHAIGGVPVAVDTIINVDDDVNAVHQDLWVLGRTFSKMRGASGTKTDIECILPYSLALDATSYGIGDPGGI